MCDKLPIAYNMKKITIILFMIVLGWPAIRSLAQPVQLRIPDLAGTAGTIIEVPVFADNSVTGLNIYSGQFRISFNSSLLSFVSVETAGTMFQAWGVPTANVSPPGYLNVAGAGTTVLSGSGTLFIIRFLCISAGNSGLDFYNGAVNNFFNEGTPASVFDNGTIDISPAPSIVVSPDATELSVGETQQFAVNGGTGPYTWSVTNPAVATISTEGLLTATTPGITRVSAEDFNGITDQTDGDILVRAMKLTIRDTSALQGSIVEIPLAVTTLAGLGITSGSIRVSFNPDILSPAGFNKTGTLLNAYTDILLNTSVPGSVSLAFAGTTALTGSGTLIYLRFNVSTSNSGGTGMNFTQAVFNEDMPAKKVNGYFSTIDLLDFSVSPYTAEMVAGETLQFTAEGGVPPYTWNTSDNSVASIDGSGLLTALKSGIIQVIATDDIGATGSSGDITLYDTYVSIPHVSAQVNTTYDLPVMITSLPAGQSVLSVQGTIGFQVPELTAVDIITTGTLTYGWTVVKVISGDHITFAIAGITGFSNPGIMFKVRFQLNPDLAAGESAYVNMNTIVLNEGIPLPKTVNGSITGSAGYTVTLKSYLQGPFNVSQMNASLNLSGYLPLSQPYYQPPWNYPGTESVGSIPNANIVDWVLVELRDATSPSTATSATIAARQAGFVLRNGTITTVDGINPMVFDAVIANNLYVVVRHRNHLAVMSSGALPYASGNYTWDFSTGSGKAYGGATAHKQIVTGIWGMTAGDGNSDGGVNNLDKNLVWKVQAGLSGYYKGDFNMNGQVENTDKNNLWKPNSGSGSQVP